MATLNTMQLAADVVVRPALERDLTELEWFGLFRTHRRMLHDTYKAAKRGEQIMLVADLNGFPIGQVWIDLVVKPDAETGAIWALRVIPCLQRLGVGTLLIAAAEDAIRSHGFHTAEIGADMDNPGARRLYERLGYAVVSTWSGEYSYTTPEGILIRGDSEQWILRKSL